jgi:hypothetical protein
MVLVGLSFGQQGKNHKESESQKTKSHTDTIYIMAPVKVEVISFPEDQNAMVYKKRDSENLGENRKMRIATEKIIAPTWWMAVAAFAALFFSGWTWIHYVVNSRKEQRARLYISLKKGWYNEEIDDRYITLRFYPTISNHGKSVAENIRMEHFVRFCENLKGREVVDYTRLFPSPSPGYPLGPQEKTRDFAVFVFSVPSDEFLAFKDPKKSTALCFYGRMIYTDTYKQTWARKFAWEIHWYNEGNRPMDFKIKEQQDEQKYDEPA